MKHSFKNLRTISKNKMVADQALTQAADKYFEAVNVFKKLYNTYHNKYTDLMVSIDEAENHIETKDPDEHEEALDLIESVLGHKLGLSVIDSQASWNDLLDLLEDDYAKKLEKDQEKLIDASLTMAGSASKSNRLYQKLYDEIK